MKEQLAAFMNISWDQAEAFGLPPRPEGNGLRLPSEVELTVVEASQWDKWYAKKDEEDGTKTPPAASDPGGPGRGEGRSAAVADCRRR